MPEAAKITGRDVMQGLARVHEAPSGEEHRRAERKNWPAHVTVSWIEETARESVDAVAHDISEGGLCLFAQQVPPAGTRVTIRFNELPQEPELEGTVRYSRHIGASLHRIGVEFCG